MAPLSLHRAAPQRLHTPFSNNRNLRITTPRFGCLKKNGIIQPRCIFFPPTCSLVMAAVAHPVGKALPGSISPSPHAYQRFYISCAGSARGFSHYNGICQFSLTRILSIYVMLLIFKELTPHSPQPQENGSTPSLLYPPLSPAGHAAVWINSPSKPSVERNWYTTAREIIIILIILLIIVTITTVK